MKISETITDHQGREIDTTYREGDPNKNLKDITLTDVHAFCFHEGDLVLVYKPNSDSWSPPGGGIESGETYQDAVIREVREETNMEVLHQELIGYMDIHDPNGKIRQTRSYCKVKPYGPFESDPGGDITEIKLINPHNYRDYFDWQETGQHIMQRAIAIDESISQETLQSKL